MRGAIRHTWERTHAITLNTTPVPPWKIFINTSLNVTFVSLIKKS
jgi:hypothetical protein